MRVAMIGATGLTGRSVVARLAADHKLHLLGRRASGSDVRETVAPADEWPAILQGEAIDVAISALGTTWNKAGSWPAFEAVDHDAVMGFAQAARASGARQFITVSSVGADLGSRNGYLAMKGRVERDLSGLGFDRLDILRPGLLRGKRGGDRRSGERLGILLSPLVNLVLRGPLDRFAAIEATIVAAAIAELAGAGGHGVFIHHNREIHRLARHTESGGPGRF
jgi:uncharacterized protein YbjT (DUF2867 family)